MECVGAQSVSLKGGVRRNVLVPVCRDCYTGFDCGVCQWSNANQELWEKGDFTRIAALMRPSGQAFVDSLGLHANQEPPLRVLDLGCGDGTTAVPLAQMGADVTGIDISRPLVEAGSGAPPGLRGLGNLWFQEGDACDLAGVADGSFDLSLSMFGAMFAPRAVRCGAGDGAGDAEGWPGGHGQLDTE